MQIFAGSVLCAAIAFYRAIFPWSSKKFQCGLSGPEIMASKQGSAINLPCGVLGKGFCLLSRDKPVFERRERLPFSWAITLTAYSLNN